MASGCSAKNEKEDLFRFKGTYVGDNSSIGNILNQLQDAAHLEGFELESKVKPYGIVLNYSGSGLKESNKKTAIYNATFLFTLVQNADWITFNFGDQAYEITRGALQKWYDADFSELKNEDELTAIIQRHLDDAESVNALFR